MSTDSSFAFCALLSEFKTIETHPMAILGFKDGEPVLAPALQPSMASFWSVCGTFRCGGQIVQIARFDQRKMATARARELRSLLQSNLAVSNSQ
jgi:hypothetical protein